MAVDITLEGDRTLIRQFEAIASYPNTKKVETQLLASARILKNKIKAAAPMGPTGNLKKGIYAARYKRRKTNIPQVYVRAGSPHSFLVEHGTDDVRVATDKLFKRGGSNRWRSEVEYFRSKRTPASAKEPGGYWTFFVDGKFRKVKEIAAMPANSFFFNTIDTAESQIYRDMKDRTMKKIEEISEKIKKKK